MTRFANLLTDSRLFLAAALALVFAGCGGSSQKNAAEPTAGEELGERPTSRRAMSPDADEEEEDDGLAVAGLRGRLDVYDIQKGMEPHSQALTDCFSSQVGRRRHLGGEIELKFVVNPDGTVKSAHIQSGDLGDWPMEECMMSVCANMKFPKPKGNAETDFTVPLSFAARGQTGIWSEEQTRADVGERTTELDECAAALGEEPPENVWITMYVGTRGKVLGAGFASPGGPLNPAWAACAAEKITAWSLTDPRGRVAKAGFRYEPGAE